jgi:hypothetical protein
VLFCLLCWSISGVAAPGALRVEQLTAANWEALYPGGPDAIAGYGDWALSNGVLCAAVSDLDHESGVTAFGGILVDLAHCGRENDQWLMSHLLPNMAMEELTRPVSLHAAKEGDAADITVRGRQAGLLLESRYRLDLEQPDRLTIRHTLTREAAGAPLHTVGVMVLHPGRALTPYALHTTNREYSLGFDLLHVDRSDYAVMLAAMQPGNLSVLMGAEGLGAPISYGVHLSRLLLTGNDGTLEELENFVITGSDYSMFGALSASPWLGSKKPGVWELLQSRWMDLEVGASLQLELEIVVKPRVDVAAVTDDFYHGTLLRGRVDTPDTRLHLADAKGRALTSVRPAPDGRFEVRLPAGVEQVEGRLLGVAGSRHWRWPVTPAIVDTGILKAAAEARVILPRGYPMRLIFRGLSSTPDPRFFDDHTGFNNGGKPLPNSRQANYLSLAGIASDPASIPLPPGRYRVFASRGLEFHVTAVDIEVRGDETVTLEVAWPTRALETPGQLAADLHVHSGASFDSALPLQERVRSFVAAGAEVLVASEHNRIVDYRGLLQEMGLDQQLRLIPGVEFTGMAYSKATPHTNGHSNAFPVAHKKRAFSGGLPIHEGVRLRELVQWARNASPRALFQLNHPRVKNAPDPALAYFDHLGVGQAYNPRLPLTAPVNKALVEPGKTGLRDVDFDLLEVLNGSDMELYRLVQQDWFSLLRQGEVSTATANSDSHDSRTLVAVPTNYVRIATDNVAELDEKALLASLAEGAVTGTTGPLLEVVLHNPEGEQVGPGDQLAGSKLVLSVTVQAAPWVPVDSLAVYLNGEVYHTGSIGRGETIDLPIFSERDAFVIVEVTGTADETYQAVLPGFTPLAFSNPIWIDANGDGQWQAPGL